MSSTAVIGLQWGDEGKGKVIDGLASDADVVARYAGGNNAGHTVIVGEEKYVLHLIPGGILHEGKINLIGRGVVVNPAALLEEMDGLVARGVPIEERLRIDGRAHVILPYHQQLDGLAEVWRGEGRIGTTGRGIGPAYADKVARTGIRVADLLDPDYFRRRLHAALAEKNAMIERVYGQKPEFDESLADQALECAERLRGLVVDGGALLRQAEADGKRILFEGAQGAMLDLDAGTYPFVTSSWTGVAGIAGGTGFPARSLNRAYAVTKAYTTRVGEGPFPSELHGEMGERLRAAGNEYGATTGRPRRCGWFDAVVARYASALNGLDGIFLTNLDVLSGFEEVPVTVGYRDGDQVLTEFPADGAVLERLEPVQEVLPGWQEDITAVRRFEDLPETCQNYVRFLEQQMGAPIERISVGPGRDQIFRGENGRDCLWT
ncbi:MAG: adenylosuccinate synthase [Planctomycetes bacterium]|nr:adenylosuccinate synthase [Planctomycetota bacterium]